MNILRSIFPHGIDAPHGIVTPYVLAILLLIAFFKILICLIVLKILIYFDIPNILGAFLPWLKSPFGPHVVLCCTIIEELYKPVAILVGNMTKPRVHQWMLDKIGLQGHEYVLDISNDSGLSFVDTATRVPNGKVIGLTNWEDGQFEAREEEIYRYAQEQSVAERVIVLDADPRTFPFEGKVFDVIISSWTISNIKNQEDRERDQEDRASILAEMSRVIKKSGTIAIIDIKYCDEFQKWFEEHGFTVEKFGPRYTFGQKNWLLIVHPNN